MAPLDRLIEIDVDTLGGVDGPSLVDDVIDRLLPLWRDALQSGGTAGMVLNLGWLMNPNRALLWESHPGAAHQARPG